MGRSVFPLTFGSLDANVFQSKDPNKPFSITARLGGLYDSQMDSASDENGQRGSDSAFSFRLGARYEMFSETGPGLRVDYSGSAQFYRKTSDDIVDNALSLVPHYSPLDRLIFSMPVSMGYAMENGDSDYYRYTLSPTCMYFLPGASHAVAFYVSTSQLDDTDTNPDLDEDGLSVGGGASYFVMLKDSLQTRFFVDYSVIDYDAELSDYTPEVQSSEKRSDTLLSIGVDVQWQATRYAGLFSSFTFINSDSNTAGNDYDRGIIEMGIVFNY